MRKVEFEVLDEIFADFAGKLAKTGLDNRILGKNSDDKIEVEVYYGKGDAKTIAELEDFLDELTDQIGK